MWCWAVRGQRPSSKRMNSFRCFVDYLVTYILSKFHLGLSLHNKDNLSEECWNTQKYGRVHSKYDHTISLTPLKCLEMGWLFPYISEYTGNCTASHTLRKWKSRELNASRAYLLFQWHHTFFLWYLQGMVLNSTLYLLDLY